MAKRKRRSNEGILTAQARTAENLQRARLERAKAAELKGESEAEGTAPQTSESETLLEPNREVELVPRIDLDERRREVDRGAAFLPSEPARELYRLTRENKAISDEFRGVLMDPSVPYGELEDAVRFAFRAIPLDMSPTRRR